MSPLIEAALERLIAAEAIHAAAGLRKLPRLARRPRAARLARALLAFAQRHAFDDPRLSRRWWVVRCWLLVCVLRLATAPLRDLHVLGLMRFARRQADTRVKRFNGRDVAGYATSSPKDDQSVRIALLLRMMGRRADAVKVLADRLRGPQPSERSAAFLADWLREAGEKKAAEALAAQREDSVPRRGAIEPYVPPRLRYAVIVLTMFDTEVFRSSVLSLTESDYHGEIVVVEDGNEPREQCRAFCEQIGVGYVKSPAWDGCVASLNLGLDQVADRADVALFSHNDVLWPRTWLADLDRAWELVWDTGKVGLLNLGYMQFASRSGPALRRLFVEREYDDLLWMLRALREVPELMARVQDVQVGPGEEPFGLARDPWVDSMPDLRQMTGRLSVAASFPVKVWHELGGFDPDLVYAFDLQLVHHNLEHRRWSLFLNSLPLIHLKSSDTGAISAERVAEAGDRFMRNTYDGFARTYGWHIEHFLNLYFSESTVVHRDAIIAAANALRFDDVDFVFDDFAQRLRERRLDNCELTWCRTRAVCPYTSVDK
ncbi:MAG: glycosyltransferase family 2 protein [Thermoleophilia bacterium]|nr:glycosyltransferase family 2 protein [Thermoleophilia bacterium]